MAKRLLLIRHAETEEGRNGRFVGATDVNASPDGLELLDRVGGIIDGYSPETWVVSPMKRSVQTAERLLAGRSGATFQVDDRLREIDFGRWEMLRFTEIAETDPGAVNRWMEYDNFVFPGGEAVVRFQQRVVEVFTDLRNLAGGDVAVISHGGVIRTMICHALGMAGRDYLSFDVRPGTLTVIDLFDEGCVLSGLGL